MGNPETRLRFESGEITQQELAEAAGCTRKTIGALEQGGYVPSLVLAFRIARVFEVGVEEVFEFVSEEDRLFKKSVRKRFSADRERPLTMAKALSRDAPYGPWGLLIRYILTVSTSISSCQIPRT